MVLGFLRNQIQTVDDGDQARTSPSELREERIAEARLRLRERPAARRALRLASGGRRLAGLLLATGRATEELSDGQMVTVDGTTGRVEPR